MFRRQEVDRGRKVRQRPLDDRQSLDEPALRAKTAAQRKPKRLHDRETGRIVAVGSIVGFERIEKELQALLGPALLPARHTPKDRKAVIAPAREAFGNADIGLFGDV